MKVWQPGSHLSVRRDVRVEDWSWQRTARRVSTLARLTAPYKLRTALAILSLLAATLTALVPPYLAKLALDDGIRQQDLQALTVIVALFVVAGLANLATSAAQTYFTGWTGERILADLRNRLFRHLQRLSLGFYERNRAGVIISRLTNDVDALDQLVTDGVTTLVQNTLLLVGSAAVLFWLDWRLALATLSVIPAMAIATAIFRIRSSRAYRAVRERLGLVTATLAEDIAGMRVVQSFTRESARRRNFEEVNAHYRAANQQTVVTNGLYFPFVDFLSAVATAVVLGYGGYLVAGGELTVGTLFAFILYVSNFFDPVQQLSQLYNTFLAAVAALDKIMDVLDEEPEVRDRPSAGELGRIDGHVELRNLRFSYGDGPEVLHGLDLDVPAGTTVALVGHTGAGKSTIAKLLARFYDPREGSITVDGTDLRDPTRPTRRSVPLPRPSARTTSSCGWRRATRPTSRNAVPGSRSASGNSWPSRGRCSPIPAS
jgi:ATP-binding cassette subfamily B protein